MTEHPFIKPAVLVADDSPVALRSLESVLQTRGHRVVAASSGEEAVRLLQEQEVAVALVDLVMPGLDGFGVLQFIKEQCPEVAMILISGTADFDVARRLLREGARDYLVKPYEPDEVHEAVSRGFAHYRAALNAVTMRNEAQKRLGELVLLKEISETASTGEDLQVLFDKIIDSVADSADVEVASLMLLDENGRLAIRAARGLSQQIMAKVRVAQGEGISGQVLATGEAILITDVQRDRRVDTFIGGSRYKNQSALSVPIRYKDRTLGVLNINNKRSGGNFNIEDQNLLTAIAYQVALAIENFKLVTNLRHQTQQLEVANRSLVKLNQARSRLVCNLSHELKTPLTSVTGYTDLILSFFDRLKGEEVRDYLGRVQEECQRMDRLISGMMRLFSIESGTEAWRWRPVPICSSLTEALMAKTLAIEAKQLQIELELPEGLWEAYGDPEKIGIVFNALLDNAVKFNRVGGYLRIQASNREDDGLGYVHLLIHNDGQSIPEESAADIFEEYTQLGDINTEKPAGVGVGLAITRAIVERMCGRISLERPEGEGSSFSLLLPTEKTFGVLTHE